MKRGSERARESGGRPPQPTHSAQALDVQAAAPLISAFTVTTTVPSATTGSAAQHSDTMEEASLLKERLQAITEKRRIQEDITKKRREIEEEKLKLQYMKKKALREQWLLDGLQSEEEQEAMRLRAQDEQQRTAQLQSNILRIEKEIKDLEAQELNISANEEAVLKRLKEVERTTEDIIKELNTDFQSEVSPSSPLSKMSLSDIFIQPSLSSAAQDPGPEEPKKATFAMEISVELNKRTGKNQVVSTTTVTPGILQRKGLKVYEDGRKSVYALPPGREERGGEVAELSSTDVEELLRQATDWSVPSEVQYHHPVYSTPYMGMSRPSTPRTSSKTTSPCSLCTSKRNWFSESISASPAVSRGESRMEDAMKHSTLNIPAKSRIPQRNIYVQTLPNVYNQPNTALVSVRASSEGTPTQTVHKKLETSPPRSTHKYEMDLIEKSMNHNRNSRFYSESVANSFPDELDLGAVTMIFMGYEKAEDDEEDSIQVELVVVGNSDEEDLKVEESLSYHPNGYTSRVFQPTVGISKVTSCRDYSEDSQ